MPYRNVDVSIIFVHFSKGKLNIRTSRDVTVSADELFDLILDDIKVVDDEYQGTKFKKVCLICSDSEFKYSIEFRLESGYGISFCCLLPNLDPAKRFTISGSYKEVNGKGKAGLFISQDGVFLKWYYTKDNPNGLPALEKKIFKGQEVWDGFAQQEFFKKELESFAEVVRGLRQANNLRVSNNSKQIESLPVIGNDDLPF